MLVTSQPCPSSLTWNYWSGNADPSLVTGVLSSSSGQLALTNLYSFNIILSLGATSATTLWDKSQVGVSLMALNSDGNKLIQYNGTSFKIY
jgi:hypothetical protein